MTELGAGDRPARALPLRLVVVPLVMVLGAALIVGALMWRADDGVDRVDITPRLGGAEPPVAAEPPEFQAASDEVEVLDDVLHVLLVGSDDRSVLTPEERVRLGTGEAEGERTETIMLLRIDPDVERIAALSIPRDLLVSRCDGSRGRINAAYAIGERTGVGGPACLVETVGALTGVDADHFVKVDFRGFLDIVDTLGGVTLYLDEPLQDDRAALDLPAGCVTLDSADALAFVRARRIDSDFGRIARQHRFLRELASEATSLGTLANVPRLFSMVETVARSLEVDEGLSMGQMRRIASTGRSLSPEAMRSYSVPVRSHRTDSAAFLRLEEDEAQRLFSAFRSGSILDDEPSDDAEQVEDALDADEPTPSPTSTPAPTATATPTPAAGSPAPIDASRYRGAASSDAEC